MTFQHPMPEGYVMRPDGGRRKIHDIIAYGRFIDAETEVMRAELQSLRCGYTKAIIDGLNEDIARMEGPGLEEVKDAMADALHEARSETSTA